MPIMTELMSVLFLKWTDCGIVCCSCFVNPIANK